MYVAVIYHVWTMTRYFDKWPQDCEINFLSQPLPEIYKYVYS